MMKILTLVLFQTIIPTPASAKVTMTTFIISLIMGFVMIKTHYL